MVARERSHRHQTSLIHGFLAGILLATAGCAASTNRWAAAPAGAATPSPVSAAPGTAPPSATPSTSAGAGRCTILPADNVWHADVSKLPVNPRSTAFVASIGAARPVHPDFGSGLIDGAPFGIPVTMIPGNQPPVPVMFDYAKESDPGPYPIPPNARIEGGPNAGGDRHVIVYEPAACRLYELFDAHRTGGAWRAGSGARYDLRDNRLRRAGATSADAAGLPILPGLVRLDEVKAGHIDHAIRLTAPKTRNAYVWPARHAASGSTDENLPPMGLRLRLRASVSLAGMPRQARVIAEALQRYGAILADNGSPWFLSGTQEEGWDNEALSALKTLHGTDFEAVDASGLMADPNSGAVRR
jgi:hypothetical protein